MATKIPSLPRLATFLEQVKGLIPTKVSQLTNDSAYITKSSLPTVNNAKITITQGGTTKGSFTLNQSGAATIALTDNNTTYSKGTASALGLTKLYTETGTATDGTMTQKAITDLIGDVETLLAAI